MDIERSPTMLRNYLAVCIMPKPRVEHSALTSIIEGLSEGDCRQAFITAGATGFVFASRHPAHDIAQAVTLFAEDSAIVVELGERFAAVKLNVAGAWLKRHLSKR